LTDPVRTTLSVLIVDDEAVARRRMRRMLESMPGVEIAGEAADGEEALTRIAESTPDVALLDVRMPEMTGLELAEHLPERTAVVFVTAYDEYAVQAFEAAAVDYLLKPVAAERLEEALARVRRLEAPSEKRELARLLREATGREGPPRVAARRGDTIRLFDPREISRFHAGAGYTIFHHGGRNYSLDDSIAALASRLEEWGFLRVHRSELINLRRVKALRRVDDATIVDLENGEQATVSRRSVKVLKKALGIVEA
jgi:DNA-binding LytR/AlgR family response regulator